MKPTSITALFQPWLIRGDHLEFMASTISERSRADKKGSFKLSDWCHVRDEMHIDSNGIAHISILGPLMNNPDPWIKKYFVLTDYKDVQSEMRAAIDEGARGTLFRIDSPGGTVSGINETAHGMDRLNAIMPTASHIDQGAYSAGYYLTAGTGTVFSSPSADVGNIGTIIRFYDNSKFLEKIGFEAKAIANDGADLKTMFFPLPLTEGQQGFLQDSVNESGKEFQEHVKKHRPGIDDEVFRAGWYSGKKAVELGLSDHVGSAQDAYDTLLGEVERRG
jgi:protease-4